MLLEKANKALNTEPSVDSSHSINVETLIKFINYIMKLLFTIKLIERTIIISYQGSS